MKIQRWVRQVVRRLPTRSRNPLTARAGREESEYRRGARYQRRISASRLSSAVKLNAVESARSALEYLGIGLDEVPVVGKAGEELRPRFVN